MILKNATIFQFPNQLRANFDDLDQALLECRLKPLGPMDREAHGFVSPFGDDVEPSTVDAQEAGQGDGGDRTWSEASAAPIKALHHRIADTLWLTVAMESKVVTSSQIDKALSQAIKDFESKNGKPPGSKTRKEIKNQIIDALLPNAPVKSNRVDVMVDVEKGLCVVNTSSKRVAESAVSLIRKALGSFPAMPISAAVDPRLVMTGWIAGDAMPEGLSLGDECEMKEPAENGAIVRCTRQDLNAEEVTRMIESGKKVTRLAHHYQDSLSFVLCDDLVIRKLKLLDGAIDQLESTEHADNNAELDARFALVRGEFLRLWDMKKEVFKIAELAT